MSPRSIVARRRRLVAPDGLAAIALRARRVARREFLKAKVSAIEARGFEDATVQPLGDLQDITAVSSFQRPFVDAHDFRAPVTRNKRNDSFSATFPNEWLFACFIRARTATIDEYGLSAVVLADVKLLDGGRRAPFDRSSSSLW